MLYPFKKSLLPGKIPLLQFFRFSFINPFKSYPFFAGHVTRSVFAVFVFTLLNFQTMSIFDIVSILFMFMSVKQFPVFINILKPAEYRYHHGNKHEKGRGISNEN